jgi:hypothetical protein
LGNAFPDEYSRFQMIVSRLAKNILQRLVIEIDRDKGYVEENLAAIEELLLKSDLNFTDKLKITLVAQMNSLSVAGSNFLFDLLEKDDAVKNNGQAGLKKRIRDIMYQFYEQGQKEGYIEKNLSFDLLYLFSEIFQAGFKSKWNDYKADSVDAETLEQLVQLCFYGIIRRP